ncbi:MAG: OmpA family protein [Micrococcales bacterium]|nr:OmpA family protein [Micrococcales bacterium]MCL2668390.1 OmpA family protein [Micrococcales bacterium]
MSAPAGKRRRRAVEEEHENNERWLISYSDMITVLMALFIVLFAISQVDQDKYIALRQSLAAGFNPGSQRPSVLDGTAGTMDGLTPASRDVAESTASLVDADQGLGHQGSSPKSLDASDPNVAAAKVELAHLDEIKESMAQALADQGLQEQVTFRITDRGLIVGLVANDVFFAAESAVLTPTADRVVDTLAPTLLSIDEEISVEGHANTVPTSARYPTNWELSVDRAAKVVRHLVETNNLPGTRVAAVGFGDTRPLELGKDEASLAANRRVDVVIVSAAPEAVRALLPLLAD